MMTLFLQSAAGNELFGFLPLIMIVSVMYLCFFRPQMKRQKEEKKFRTEVKKGSRVVTTSGIHGKVLEVAENYIILESENSRLKLEKSAISKELSAQYSTAEK